MNEELKQSESVNFPNTPFSNEALGEVSETSAEVENAPFGIEHELSTVDDQPQTQAFQADDVAGQEQIPAEAQDASLEKKPRKKTLIAIAVVTVLVVVIGVAAGLFINAENQRKAAEEAAEAARIAEIESYNRYVDNLSSARIAMLQGCATSETACNLLTEVWRSAIWDHDISEWSDETKPYYATDFNDALALLYASDTYKGYVDDIKKNEDTVESLMKELRNPPSDCEKAYDVLQEFYTQYKSFTKLATNASGSYQTVSQSFRDLDSACITKFDQLETVIPDKKPVE